MGTVLSVVVATAVGLPLLFVLLAFLRLRAGRQEELREQQRLGIRTKHQIQQHRQRLREAILANPYALTSAFQLARMIRNRETTSKRAFPLSLCLSFVQKGNQRARRNKRRGRRGVHQTRRGRQSNPQCRRGKEIRRGQRRGEDRGRSHPRGHRERNPRLSSSSSWRSFPPHLSRSDLHSHDLI